MSGKPSVMMQECQEMEPEGDKWTLAIINLIIYIHAFLFCDMSQSLSWEINSVYTVMWCNKAKTIVEHGLFGSPVYVYFLKLAL